LVSTRLTLLLDTEQGDVLALSHAAAQLVQLLRSDNSRCDARAQRLQVKDAEETAGCGVRVCDT
jgi:hypothetical protein